MAISRIVYHLFLLIVVLSTSIAHADYPLNTDLPAITPDNAARFTELARIDGTLQGQLAWSGNLLAVGTTAGVQLFDTAHPDEPPMTITGDVNIAFNEAGDTLISGGQRWDVETGDSLGVIEPETDSVFSPSGNIEVTSSLVDGSIVVQLNNVNTGEVIALNTQRPSGYIRPVFSPDEQVVAFLFAISNEYGAHVQLWRLTDGNILAILNQQLEYFDDVRFHADGDLLVVTTFTDAVYSSIFEDVQIYDGHTGERLRIDHLSTTLPVAYSFDHALMAFGTTRGIELWSDHEIGLLECGVNNEIMGYAGNPLFSPTDYSIAAYQFNGAGAIWHLDSSGTLIEPCVILETDTYITGMAYSADGTLLAGATNDKMVYLWDAQTGVERFRLNVGGLYSFTMRFHPTENKLLIEQFADGYQVWDTTTGEQLLTAPRGAVLNADWSRAAYWDGGIVRVINGVDEITFTVIEDYLGTTAAMNPTRQWVAFVGAEIGIYDLQTGDQVFNLPIENPGTQVIFNPQGTHMLIRIDPIVYSPSTAVTLQIWDTANLNEPISQFETPNIGRDYLFSPNGELLAHNQELYGEGGYGSEILFDTATGERLVSWEHGDYGDNSHAFSLDGSLLATGRGDRSIALWDVAATLEQTPQRENSTRVEGVMYAELRLPSASFVIEFERIVFSADGEWIAAQVFNRQHPESSIPSSTDVYVWSLTEALGQGGVIEDGYIEFPNATAPHFSPSGDWLVTKDVEFDILRLWETATGDELHVFPETRLSAFSPDESILVTYGANGLTLWDVSTLMGDNTAPLITLTDLPENVQEIAFNEAGTLLFVRYTNGVNIYGIAP
jgi:WD40 repeat protein